MSGMKSRSGWTAKPVVVCYFVVFMGNLIGGFSIELVMLAIKIDILGLPFPFALLSVPVVEIIILTAALSFARHEGAGLKELGLKKASPKVLTLASAAAVGIGLLMFKVHSLLNPDMANEYMELWMPRNSFQLAVMIATFLLLGGPCEELTFRGFFQKGLENSFGKMKGLLTASVLFAVWHVSLYQVAFVFPVGFVLGYVWQRTDGNTTVSALMHGAVNSTFFTGFFLSTL